MKRPECVTWRDANFSAMGDAPLKEEYLVKTVGWVKKRGRWLIIESEHTPAGARAVTRVPIENVVKRRKLK